MRIHDTFEEVSSGKNHIFEKWELERMKEENS